MRPALRLALALLACSALVHVGHAHVRLIHPTNGNKLHWSSPGEIGIVINAAGSDDVTDASHFTALRGALRAWNDVTGTEVELDENTSSAQQARTDWEDNDIHLILFDEDDDSGFFDDSPGTVALTPVWFTSNGAITDADILFNGQDHAFTTSGGPGAFDIEDVAAHELGHLLGLDHSGWAGSTMYPYVDTTTILHRSLSLDEVRGLRDIDANQDHASIRGRIRRASDDSTVSGAHVVARDAQGRSAAGSLADSSGDFDLDGLSAGTYEVYATPLDQPVVEDNLGQGYEDQVEIDFESTLLGSFPVAASEDLEVGDLHVEDDVVLRLGSAMDVYPLRCTTGESPVFIVRGQQLVNGSTLEASDPALFVAVIAWQSSQVTFRVDVPPNATPGHVDLTAMHLGARSILTAALEITPPDPEITDVDPASGSHLGGTLVTLTGSNFRAGARVVLGAHNYVDGDAQGATVIDANTITLTTRASASGTCDVVVIDATGVEGRAPDGFQFAQVPSVQTCFPTAGSASGGTLLTLRGAQFAAGCTVSIDAVQQTQVTVVSATRIEVITDAGVPGGPYVLSVENPGGATASAAFSYVAASDPLLSDIDPPQGSESGGTTLILSGANFTPDATVSFGASATTGLGGTPASSVVFVDANTLEVVTPEHDAGEHNVLVQIGSTGQAVVAADGFTFTAEVEDDDGGGGGCSVVPAGGPTGGPHGARDALAGCVWMLLAFAIVHARARRMQARA